MLLTSLGYSGEFFDTAARQQYLRARFYNPANGQFNRLDPFAGNVQDPQSLHKYAYVHGDPVQRIDPSGLRSLGTVSASIAITTTMGATSGYAYYRAGRSVSFGIASGLLGGTALSFARVTGNLVPVLLEGLMTGLGAVVIKNAMSYYFNNGQTLNRWEALSYFLEGFNWGAAYAQFFKPAPYRTEMRDPRFPRPGRRTVTPDAHKVIRDPGFGHYVGAGAFQGVVQLVFSVGSLITEIPRLSETAQASREAPANRALREKHRKLMIDHLDNVMGSLLQTVLGGALDFASSASAPGRLGQLPVFRGLPPSLKKEITENAITLLANQGGLGGMNQAIDGLSGLIVDEMMDW